ncbi:hypothetical protein Tco_0684648 [Tanacetum coccineum]
MVRVGCMTYFQDHKWYDELTDGMLKEEALIKTGRMLVESKCSLKRPIRSLGKSRPGNAKSKTKKAYDPYLDINRIFVRNYEENNAGNIQDNKKEHHDPSICNVRRFKMIKYSFDANEEYVAIKEHERLDHSRTNIDACQAYRELFRIMDVGWLVTKAKYG